MNPVHRLKATLALQGHNLKSASDQLGVSRTHLVGVFDGTRHASAAFLARLETLIGRDGLYFVRHGGALQSRGAEIPSTI